MRKLALVLVVALVGCGTSLREERAAEKAAAEARPNIAPVINGPSDPLIRQFEVQFSDGTKAGCISVWNQSVSCVPLKGAL
jgi:hypothetical protein